MDGNISFKGIKNQKAKNLIKDLLNPDAGKRLGSSSKGSQDVKNHKWFEFVDWNHVLLKDIHAPFVPVIKSPTDTKYFKPDEAHNSPVSAPSNE